MRRKPNNIWHKKSFRISIPTLYNRWPDEVRNKPTPKSFINAVTRVAIVL